MLTLSPLLSGREDALAPAVHEVESYRGDTDRALVDLRAHVTAGGTAVLVVGGQGTAQRSLEQLRDADVPATLVDRLTESPETGLVTVTCGRLTEGFTATASALVVLDRGRPHRQPGGGHRAAQARVASDATPSTW